MAGGLVAYAIGAHLDGALGWRAWRWIVLVNGVPTVLTGLAVPLLLPNSPATASFLTTAEKEALALMQQRELGGGRGRRRPRNADELDWQDVRDGLRDPTLWLFCVVQYCVNNMLYSFSVFLPTIIHGLGTWDGAAAQALTAPVYAAGAATYLVNARLSDRTQRRGAFAMGAMMTSIAGYGLLVANAGTATSYAGCFLVSMGLYSVGGIMLAWVMVNNPRYGKRAITSGMQLTVGNAAGVASSYMFESRYAPAFYPGYGATIGLLVLGLACIVVLHCVFRWENRRRARGSWTGGLRGGRRRRSWSWARGVLIFGLLCKWKHRRRLGGVRGHAFVDFIHTQDIKEKLRVALQRSRGPGPARAASSVGKPKVQAPVAPVALGLEIRGLIVRRQGVPGALSRAVTPHVVGLCANQQDNVPGDEGEQDAVAAAVERRVVGAVDVGAEDGAGLGERMWFRVSLYARIIKDEEGGAGSQVPCCIMQPTPSSSPPSCYCATQD